MRRVGIGSDRVGSSVGAGADRARARAAAAGMRTRRPSRWARWSTAPVLPATATGPMRSRSPRDEVNAALASAKSPIRFQFLVNDSTNVPTVAVARATDLVSMRGAKGLVTDTSQDTLETVKLQYDADPAKHLDVPIVGAGADVTIVRQPDGDQSRCAHADCFSRRGELGVSNRHVDAVARPRAGRDHPRSGDRRRHER